MINCIIHLGEKWSSYGNTFVMGNAFSDTGLLKGTALAEHIGKSDDTAEACRRINGFFSFILKDSHRVLIGADKIRSYPLFYGIASEKVYISDDPYWVKDQTGEEQFDKQSQTEFLLLGFVSGSSTLYKNVKQIQAGEIVSFQAGIGSSIKISSSRYYNYIHKDYFEKEKEWLIKEHERVLTQAFRRLICMAEGRTLVIPLSGGYDSRLVATMLRKLGYSNIITFTFGKVDNHDSIISKRVAERLGLKWFFIPYDNDSAYIWYNSVERKDFSKKADGLSTIIQDREWPAIGELKKKKLIPADSLIVPGHSGDFTSGGWIPRELCSSHVTEMEFIEAILKKHYVMWNWTACKNTLGGFFAEKIRECIDFRLFNMQTEADNAYEMWVWQEDQAKHVVNTTRIYDYYGYKWWLPLWDSEYLNYWSRIPLEWRFGKKLYKESVSRLYSQVAQVSPKEALLRDSSLDKANMTEKLANLVLRKILHTRGLKASASELRNTDWEQSYGRLNENLYQKLMPYIVGRSSCATLERLGYINYESSEVPAETLNMLQELGGF